MGAGNKIKNLDSYYRIIALDIKNASQTPSNFKKSGN